MPSVHREFAEEPDCMEGTLLAPLPPPFRDERRGAKAGTTWEAVDDLVDGLLWK